jgi:DNA helicase-2/ATP-dependent DNA helicase PcrA
MPDSKPWLDGIEGDHVRRLIESDAAAIQAVAGPGSGKTTGLKGRIRRLVEGDGVAPGKIFAGTFTRAIAADLLAALSKAIPVDNLDKPVISTLHSLALQLLRETPTAAPGRAFRFLLEHEEEAMLYDVGVAVPELGDFDARRDELRKMQAFWANATTLDDERFKGAVAAWLTANAGMLIGEVVYLANSALGNGDLETGAFEHVIVDEYQDLTRCEQAFVEQIKAPDGSLVVLGDDDQSIYRFRHNHPGGITEFPAQHDPRTLEEIRIPENRRCGAAIVDLANRMMAAAGSHKEPMISKSPHAGEVDYVFWPDMNAEISGLAAYMQAHPTEKFLVLVPRRVIGYRLKDVLGEQARTSFHEQVLRAPIVRERFALAALLAVPEDRVALRAWFGFKGESAEMAPERNAQAVKSLASVELTGTALLTAIGDGSLLLTGAGKGNVRRRAQRYIEAVATLPTELGPLVEALFDPLLAAEIADDEDRLEAVADFELLCAAALERLTREKEPTLLKVVDTLRYRISTRMPLTDDEVEPRIQIMTLHGAKGLEADAIVVAGLADQILPGLPGKTPAEDVAHREEQRRLLYVAVTRAKQKLILSWPKQATLRYATSYNILYARKDIRTVGGERIVPLSKSRFLEVPARRAETGAGWLARTSIPADISA